MCVAEIKIISPGKVYTGYLYYSMKRLNDDSYQYALILHSLYKQHLHQSVSDFQSIMQTAWITKSHILCLQCQSKQKGERNIIYLADIALNKDIHYK